MTASLFIDNAILNILWSRLFFVKHLFARSIIEMIALWIITMMLIIATWSRSKWSAILLIPYAIWLIIATVLALQVMILN
ncbi:tryptophan-rich sensory protein [Patescibacteria group bacterium]|nr:tryptophan-rich sensory protein [Patescibacteria group bacterium]MBU1758797.1 tryptophan-rich sensory protein [Patescibacteria group bacterium]